MSGRVRIGLVGPGLIARRAHLPAHLANADAVVAAIAAGRRERAEAVAAEFGVPRVYDDWRELIAARDIDAVDICAPNHLHAEIAVAAAAAGKHVLVEKPMAVSLAEADGMIAAADRAGVVLMVAHNLRFAPLYREVKRLLDEGAIGRLLAARGFFMHAGPDEFWGAESDWFWDAGRAGGGSLLDMGIHMVDLMRWYVGEAVTEVSAMTSRMLKPSPFEDNAVVLMRFEGGLVASVQSSWSARPQPDRGLTIHGEEGYIAAGRSPSEPLVLHVRQGGGEDRILLPVPAAADAENPFAHFVRCVQTGARPLTGGAEGRASLEVVLAAYRAERIGRFVSLSAEP
jgi:UDP-N-acetylglucosamine 3-dehydrogenase